MNLEVGRDLVLITQRIDGWDPGDTIRVVQYAARGRSAGRQDMEG